MSDSANPRYGTPNWEMLRRWFELPAEQDGQFWALNLMKYRDVADYSDGRETTISGQEADDIYAPIEILESLGAVPAYGASVTAQHAGDPAWDRVAIVRYPSRAEFFEMQRRPDFIERHIHKDAGMEFTIVMSCDAHELPAQPGTAEHGSLVLSVSRFPSGAAASERSIEGVTPVAHFDVEGPIIGDERRWHEARFDRVTDAALSDYIAAAEAEEQVVVVLDDETPVIGIDVLLESVASRS